MNSVLSVVNFSFMGYLRGKNLLALFCIVSIICLLLCVWSLDDAIFF